MVLLRLHLALFYHALHDTVLMAMSGKRRCRDVLYELRHIFMKANFCWTDFVVLGALFSKWSELRKATAGGNEGYGLLLVYTTAEGHLLLVRAGSSYVWSSIKRIFRSSRRV